MRRGSFSAGGLLVFLVYGLFALFSLLLVVIGAGVYQGVVETGRNNTQARASLFYLANQVRMCSGEARLLEENGQPALVLQNAGSASETLIWYEDGVLWEYYGPAGGSLADAEGMGERIAEPEDFSLETIDGVLTARVRVDGRLHSMALCGTA